MFTMIKKDACLWPSHKDVQAAIQDLFPAGGKRVITYNGVQTPVSFVPMNGANGLRALSYKLKSLPVGVTPEVAKMENANTAIWNKIPYGSEVEVSTLLS